MSNLQLYSNIYFPFSFLAQLGKIKIGMTKLEVDSLVQLEHIEDGFPFEFSHIEWFLFRGGILYFTDSFKLMNLSLRLHYHLPFSWSDSSNEREEAILNKIQITE